MAQLQSENSLLSQFIREQQVKKKPFPLRQLLELYTRAKLTDVYCDYFSGFKCLVNWLGPIDTSGYNMQQVFQPLYNYEQQEIAVILRVHPSIIQQAFLDIYSNGH